MIEIINKFEKIIYAVLMVMLMVVLITSLLDLCAIMYDALWVNTPGLLKSHELISVLGAFLLVLIGVELLDTIKAYFIENTIHVEIVILLAIIAMARKVILLDPTSQDPFAFGFELMGIGVIVLGLGAGYYLIKKSGLLHYPAKKKTE
ncbi:MAG: phosphate-starvation-inducible PsiE family protein [Methanoregula sp.]|nr:phosphate-starvation-inducible PsiE family protein [Methanoregula sp.]